MYSQRVIYPFIPRRSLIQQKFKGCKNNKSSKKYSSTAPGLSEITLKLYDGLLRGDRASLARSITLVESTHPEKSSEAQKLIGLANAHSKAVGLENKTFRYVIKWLKNDNYSKICCIVIYKRPHYIYDY